MAEDIELLVQARRSERTWKLCAGGLILVIPFYLAIHLGVGSTSPVSALEKISFNRCVNYTGTTLL